MCGNLIFNLLFLIVCLFSEPVSFKAKAFCKSSLIVFQMVTTFRVALLQVNLPSKILSTKALLLLCSVSTTSRSHYILHNSRRVQVKMWLLLPLSEYLFLQNYGYNS